jgi:hypothetical protein
MPQTPNKVLGAFLFYAKPARAKSPCQATSIVPSNVSSMLLLLDLNIRPMPGKNQIMVQKPSTQHRLKIQLLSWMPQTPNKVLGAFLFYARAVESAMLVALNTIASQQSKGIRATMIALTQLLNCTCIDASCSSVPKARSRAAGFHYLSEHPRDPNAPPLLTDPEPPSNGPIQVCTQILKEVLSSASEAELAAPFHNGKEACPSCACLEELPHPQPPTPMQTNNSTAAGVLSTTVSNESDPKPSTWDSVGFAIAFAKTNLLSAAGKRAFSAKLIILPSIIRLPLIATFTPPICTLTTTAPATVSNVSKMPTLQKPLLCPPKLSRSPNQ